MADIELKPVSQQTIQEKGYTPYDLWLVLRDEEEYGPFETQSLRHYSSEHPHLFMGTIARRLNSEEWQPFFDIPPFQRRSQEYEHDSSGGPYWLFIHAQKSGPFTFEELEKKLHDGHINRTELFSPDDGLTWKKIYQIPAFDRRNLNSESLPNIPNETSFEKAKQDVGDMMDAHKEKPHQEGLTDLAFLGQKKEKTVILKLDEITLEAIQETDIKKSLKWFIPAMVSCLAILVFTAWYFVTPNAEAPIAEVPDNSSLKVVKREVIMPKVQTTQAHVPVTHRRQAPAVRTPSSVVPQQPRPASAPVVRQERQPESDYPTHVETHGADRAPANDNDYQDQPPADMPQDHYQDQGIDPAQNEDPNRDQVQQDNPKEEHNLIFSNGKSPRQRESGRYPARQDSGIDESATDQQNNY